MALSKQDRARCFLWSQGVPLINFTDYRQGTTERIAHNAGKPALTPVVRRSPSTT